ncbi:tetratricopeptide repeat protein [Phenylobacterium soli]|uniref:Uncharacterized protein n=1 Tax=Phenylobacterium soli TaxID=2170551 RepID=A0A328AEX5_9CAUL|nr:hypothetical protein [Phenylobacterium soli]RAK53085.1 hypothetical protein DJ017_00325 [Phenylobacterium soli]
MIDLKALERAAYGRGADRVDLVLGALAALERVQPVGGAETEAAAYTRLAAAIAAVLGDPDLSLSEAEAQSLVINRAIMGSLFAASGFGSTAFALEAMTPAGARLPGLPVGLRRRIEALQGLDTANALSAADVLDLPADEALLVTASLLSTSPVLTPLGAARREALLAAAERLAGARLAPRMTLVAVLASAWMICSYASGPGKHRIKAVFNQVLRRLNAEIGFALPEPASPRPRPERPTMVVVAEVIRSGHVQYRYFGQYLRQLRTRFRLVLAAPQGEIDEHVRPLFDETFGFDPYGPPSFLGDVAGFVAAQAPDIVFWPSVGMARWGPLLANLRLAPIQMTALGHSASTFIPEMDYYLTEEGYVSDPALFSEKVLALPDASLRFERHPRFAPPAPEIRERPEPLRVAIPSNLLKLNPGYLAVLRRILDEAGRAIELHVFPNAGGVRLAALKAASPFLGKAVIHGRTSAQDYAEALNRCDLVLSPFPFGGLHSVVDALRQGLPVVALEGAEPHSRTDSMILRRVGMPEALIAQDEAGYVAAALRLIRDDAWRVELGRRAVALDIDSLLFGDGSTPLGSEVVDAVWQAFRHHEAIMADPRRLWPLTALRNLG